MMLFSLCEYFLNDERHFLFRLYVTIMREHDTDSHLLSFHMREKTENFFISDVDLVPDLDRLDTMFAIFYELEESLHKRLCI